MPNYNYVIGGRSSGKTRKIMELAKEKNAIVICKNAAAMERKAAAYGIFGLKFMSYSDVLLGIHADYCEGVIPPNSNYVVDEVKDFTDFLLASNCIGFTQTEDD